MKANLIFNVLGLAVCGALTYYSIYVRIEIILMLFGILGTFLFFVGTGEAISEMIDGGSDCDE